MNPKSWLYVIPLLFLGGSARGDCLFTAFVHNATHVPVLSAYNSTIPGADGIPLATWNTIADRQSTSTNADCPTATFVWAALQPTGAPIGRTLTFGSDWVQWAAPPDGVTYTVLGSPPVPSSDNRADALIGRWTLSGLNVWCRNDTTGQTGNSSFTGLHSDQGAPLAMAKCPAGPAGSQFSYGIDPVHIMWTTPSGSRGAVGRLDNTGANPQDTYGLTVGLADSTGLVDTSGSSCKPGHLPCVLAGGRSAANPNYYTTSQPTTPISCNASVDTPTVDFGTVHPDPALQVGDAIAPSRPAVLNVSCDGPTGRQNVQLTARGAPSPVISDVFASTNASVGYRLRANYSTHAPVLAPQSTVSVSIGSLPGATPDSVPVGLDVTPILLLPQPIPGRATTTVVVDAWLSL